MLRINVSPLIAAEGYFFCLDTKEAKDQVSKEASLRTEPLPCKATRTTGCKILPPLRSRKVRASGKYCYALATALPTIVLPAFARSFFADRVCKILLIL